jgi:hypothetical protein
MGFNSAFKGFIFFGHRVVKPQNEDILGTAQDVYLLHGCNKFMIEGKAFLSDLVHWKSVL